VFGCFLGGRRGCRQVVSLFFCRSFRPFSADRLIADPDAVARNSVPKAKEVLFYTDVVEPRSSTTIHFRAPSNRGCYPFLCTFPGHWMVMNGEMLVE
jgi:hypothetical protein